MRPPLIVLAILLLAACANAGEMITPNNPVAFHFECQDVYENGTRMVYISDYMLPNPEPG